MFAIMYYNDFINDWLLYGTFRSFGKCFLEYQRLKHMYTNKSLKLIKINS